MVFLSVRAKMAICDGLLRGLKAELVASSSLQVCAN